MRKVMFVVVIACIAGAIALADVGNKMGSLHQEVTQKQKVIHARALLQNARSTIRETNIRLQEIADSGSMDSVDAEIKQALLAAWNVCKDAQIGFEDVVVAELLDWSASK